MVSQPMVNQSIEEGIKKMVSPSIQSKKLTAGANDFSIIDSSKIAGGPVDNSFEKLKYISV